MNLQALRLYKYFESSLSFFLNVNFYILINIFIENFVYFLITIFSSSLDF